MPSQPAVKRGVKSGLGGGGRISISEPEMNTQRKTFRPRRLAVVCVTLAILVAVACGPTLNHVRATVLLMRFGGMSVQSVPAMFGNRPLRREEVSFDGPDGLVKARIYWPEGVSDPPGVVMLHGIHKDGYTEPRMVAFAEAVAGAGIAVMTPTIQELADYRVDAASVATIGSAAKYFRKKLDNRRVGLMGMCFGGGLCLMTAGNPKFSDDVAFVTAIGSHDDLARIARFFVTNEIERPDGSKLKLNADPYGPMVIVYSRVNDFFTPADGPVARDALRLWLWGEFDNARKLAEKLSPEGKTRIGIIFDGKYSQLAPEMLKVIEQKSKEMAAVSPDGFLKDVKVPVFLLHGAHDNVVPPSESLWLERGLKVNGKVHTLVSPAVGHVEMAADTTTGDKWEVIHFLAQIVDTAKSAK